MWSFVSIGKFCRPLRDSIGFSARYNSSSADMLASPSHDVSWFDLSSSRFKVAWPVNLAADLIKLWFKFKMDIYSWGIGHKDVILFLSRFTKRKYWRHLAFFAKKSIDFTPFPLQVKSRMKGKPESSSIDSSLGLLQMLTDLKCWYWCNSTDNSFRF